jgi:hypothetical protein
LRGGDLKERNNLEDLGLDTIIISKWILKIVCDGMDGINLATYRDKWEALVEVAINFRFL